MYSNCWHHRICPIPFFLFILWHAADAQPNAIPPRAFAASQAVRDDRPLPLDTLATSSAEPAGPGDPTVQRLFIMPTAHTIREGALMIGVHEFLWADLGYAPTDWLQFTALYTPIPNGLGMIFGVKAQVVPEYGFFHGLAVGADAYMIDLNGGQEVAAPMPVFTATASAGNDRVEASLSFSGGYHDRPVFGFSQVGIAIYNDHRDLAFIAESLIGPGADRSVAIDNYLLMAGIRTSSARFSFEGAFMTSPVLANDEWLGGNRIYPYLSGTYYF